MKINPAELIYIEGMRNYINLHTETGTIIIHATLTSFEENKSISIILAEFINHFLSNSTK
ncbi:LytTR family transcriptional regulator DNA-binding domain-containing protein [Chryseobacterium arthrosphaerae]|uniref:LytTR family transcriptional regulator DNA-binding domain-containing protein n=1 Tax=Chryseobacterium arthrosphaerae TaxID=651561 RepID=UPI00374CEED5